MLSVDVGEGVPANENVTQIGQASAPCARVVYVDSDPVVCSHAQALLADNEQTIAIRADIREPGEIVGNQALCKLIDLDQPVAILLLTVLHPIPDDNVVRRATPDIRYARRPSRA